MKLKKHGAFCTENDQGKVAPLRCCLNPEIEQIPFPELKRILLLRA